MVGCLIFIAGLVTGGGIAVILLSCLQINRIDKYESKTNKFRTEDNKNIMRISNTLKTLKNDLIFAGL